MSSKIDVFLIYPYFHREPFWRKLWLFPPLGLGYLAGTLRENGFKVSILDGTFMRPEVLIKRAKELSPKIAGIYCMVTMRDDAIMLANAFKNSAEKPLLVAGGPFPTSSPHLFLDDFDAVVLGEGEATMLELVKRYLAGEDISGVDGVAFKRGSGIVCTEKREYIDNLDAVPHPARELFENEKYMQYWKRKFGYSCAPIITTRGCPYNCDYCARPVFGNRYRERGVVDIINEIEEVLAQGYECIWFSDDVFTLNKERILHLCDEILKIKLVFSWSCLCRVDNVDEKLLRRMHEAGCTRVLFGIESGDDKIMTMMGKSFTVESAEKAVNMARNAGIEVGTFFMVGYPGENDETILRTLRFSSRLHSDYLSYTLPYPLPGTQLYERLSDRLTKKEWKMAGHNLLMFRGDFSQAKLRFAVYKGMVQHRLRKHGFAGAAGVFENITDKVFRMLG